MRTGRGADVFHIPLGPNQIKTQMKGLFGVMGSFFLVHLWSCICEGLGCVHVCVCAWACICTHVCIAVCTVWCVCVYARVCVVDACDYVHVPVRVVARVCCVRACVCMRLCVRTHMCLCLRVSVFVMGAGHGSKIPGS